VEELENFYSEIINKYTTASNDYYSSYLKLKTSRSVEKLVNHEQ
jgi:hypothetical protein